MKIITIILGLVLVACGGETETSDTTPPPVDTIVADNGNPDGGLDSSSDVIKDIATDIADIVEVLDDAVADADVPVQPDTSTPGGDTVPDVIPDTQPSPDLASDGSALPEGLTGVAPEGETALATYTQVVDQTGATVLPDHLVGQWSVLWFYPVAGTKG